MEKKQIISVVGIGYIGIPLTAALANVGYEVIGIDIDQKKVDALNNTYWTDIFEPGVNETMKKHKDAISFTTDGASAVRKSDAVLVTVGTPLNENNEPNYEYIRSATEMIGKNLKKGHIIIFKSTVILGTTEELVMPRLEQLSGLKAGKDFYLAFCPERTIEGLALHEIYTLPKIVGGVDRESTEKAAGIMEKLGSKVVKVSSPRVAEMCKLVDNLYRATNIAFANEVGEICESIGIDAVEVVRSVNDSYERTHLFRPGLGADGPCLSKDPYIFTYAARKNNIQTPVTSGCIEGNTKATERIAYLAIDFIRKNNIKNPEIAYIGLAFKGFPETDDIRGSPAIKIAKIIDVNLPNAICSYFDPIVKNFAGKPVEATIDDAMKGKHIVLFLNNHPRIMNISSSRISEAVNKPAFIANVWRNIKDAENLKKVAGITVFSAGDGRA